LQPHTKNKRCAFPHPALNINIHKTFLGRQRRILYDTGNDAGAPMALFQSGGFETKVKSSGLTAEETISPKPLCDDVKFPSSRPRSTANSEAKSASKNRSGMPSSSAFEKRAFLLSSNIELRRAKKI
jgi:hypothetical protein